ncbi:ester cyclase [Streptomyces glaucus]|uniref:SnoaL-like domain-containing protein n=1 Tax=Streptomyces glaucus TaxID=284029 RepID=A0ABN3J4Z8_9ACTN
MAPVQLIECRTDRFDETNRLTDTWVERTRGKRTATHAVLGKGRSDTSHIVESVESPSYEEAMRNSDLPKTDRVFRKMVALRDEMPTFTDLEVVRDEQPNQAPARAFFGATGRTGPGLLSEFCTGDHVDHGSAHPGGVRGLAASAEQYGDWRAAFGFSLRVDGRTGEGDQMGPLWTWTARHEGAFPGVPPTGQDVSMTGSTWHHFRDGKICEGWWHHDRAGPREQLGASCG